MCRRELLEFDSKQALETLEHRGLGDTPSSASVSGRPFFADQVKAEEEESKKTLEKLRLSQQSSSRCVSCVKDTCCCVKVTDFYIKVTGLYVKDTCCYVKDTCCYVKDSTDIIAFPFPFLFYVILALYY